MGLLQRQRQTYSTTQPLYNIGSQKTFLIVGLGNFGKKYQKTRHNIGFMAVDDFAERNEMPGFKENKDLKCQVTIDNLSGNRVILIKPLTQMNLSGQAVRAVQEYYDLYNEQTLVIYDELAIEFGQIRMRVGGESAGHNGVKSLIEHIGEDFGRLRVGIGSDIAKKAKPESYVLKEFSKNELKAVGDILREASAITTEFIFSGGSLPHDTRAVL